MSGEHVVPCADLDEAVSFLVDRLGFRLEMVFPADAPAVAVVAGHGLSLRLESSSAGPAPVLEPAPIVTRVDDTGWHTGRAGMRYRDLVPGRYGGQIIASHIRIDDGGPVPDYVHHHAIRFQLIYCYRGWVRVVYEDQGPPFVLEPGDCVLQPPHIRHRVLECSPGLEVIEIGSPAEHETRVDHELALPTADVRPERAFGGQRFVRHVAADAAWTREGAADVRDLGIAAGTGGVAGARVVRGPWPARAHDGEAVFGFVLTGGGLLDLDGDQRSLTAGDAFAVPSGIRFALAEPDRLEVLEVSVPARAR